MQKTMYMKEVDLYADEVMQLDMIFSPVEKGFTEVDLNPGTAMLWDMYEDKDVQTVRGFISAKGAFPLHEHLKSVETLVLYLGDADLLCEDADCIPIIKTFELGKPFYLDPGKRHKVIARIDSKFIAVFVPPDKALPQG